LRGIDWLVQVGEVRIQRQMDIGDAIDAKAGVLFVYCGAILVAAVQLATPRDDGLMWAAMGLALVAMTVAGFLLWPQTYQDPPDPEKLEAYVRDEPAIPSPVIVALVDEQLKAIAFNEAVVRIKAGAMKVVLVLSAIATVLLGLEIGQGRGT
jgi:hypothetical protein